MSAWDESNWAGYQANILNVFSSGSGAWIEFRYTLGYVGWRPLRADTPLGLSQVLQVAVAAKSSNVPVWLRVTNPGEITAIQTI
ncbi:MAG: hypothetical protein WAW96_22005 [Alphaproteobacteria bacterium]